MLGQPMTSLVLGRFCRAGGNLTPGDGTVGREQWVWQPLLRRAGPALVHLWVKLYCNTAIHVSTHSVYSLYISTQKDTKKESELFLRR